MRKLQQVNLLVFTVRFGQGNELQVMTSNSSGFLPVCYVNWTQKLTTQTCQQLGFRGCVKYTCVYVEVVFVSEWVRECDWRWWLPLVSDRQNKLVSYIVPFAPFITTVNI